MILGKRFGWRRRSYIAHHGKTLSRKILQEMQQEFTKEIHETSTHRFRSEGKDVNTLFMHLHYIVERHREVLLESYLVHRSDANGDGLLDIEERQVLLTQIQTALKQKVARKSLQEQLLAMTTSHLPLPKVSKSVWSSMDGYPFTLKTPSNPTTEEMITDPNPPMFTVHDPPHTRVPEFDFVEMCLTKDFGRPSLADVKVNARRLFELMSKEYPYCGDTLLSILIPSSMTGLHHLLPPPSHQKYSDITHQLHNYAYTITETSSEFIMAPTAESLKRAFNRALRTLKDHGLAQFCVNDDAESDFGALIQRLDLTLKGILQGYFGGLTADRGRSPVEKAETVEDINDYGKTFWSSASLHGGPGYE